MDSMKAVSLFSGAGGMDAGFARHGIHATWANDSDHDACETYRANIGNHVRHGDITDIIGDIPREAGKIDVLFGGPPCQGFSVAGKMDPRDQRSRMVWIFVNVVRMIMPWILVMENVPALATLSKWRPVREALIKSVRTMGYMTSMTILDASRFDVPQSRRRAFMIGIRGDPSLVPDINAMMTPYATTGKTVREALSILDRAGTGNNADLTPARITMPARPILRKSPYAGMLFNGAGRPIRIDGHSCTLPATMGGNRTPIIDEKALYENSENWVEDYHRGLMAGEEPLSGEAPPRLRRLTVKEAAVLQTFPPRFGFHGSRCSVFRQIGNAVPCNLAAAIARMLSDLASGRSKPVLARRAAFEIQETASRP